MIEQRQLAELLLDLKSINSVDQGGQAELIDKSSALLQTLRSDNPSWQSLNKALEDVSQRHDISYEVKNKARRIVESWVPF